MCFREFSRRDFSCLGIVGLGLGPVTLPGLLGHSHLRQLIIPTGPLRSR